MKKYIFLLPLFVFFTYSNLSGFESAGHISLMEGDVTIVKTDGEMLRGNINYPLVTGDVILTGKSGRCELLLSNGTLLRLDSNSDIKLISLFTESVTSDKKISTLKLMSGSVYSMAQIYKNEILQIITPQISVKMENRSTNLIRTSEKESSVRVIRGKIGVIYGNQSKINIKSGELVIFPRKGKKYSSKIESDDEFLSWNRSINNSFKKLHYGKSNVPEAIYIHSPGIVHFAEKFSTKFGTWEYSELFGYVWKPSDENFKVLSRRPFFDANYVSIDDELVLVPNQKWGWAPIHLGTWFFSKSDGWLWIPGKEKFEELHSGTQGFDGFFWNTEIDYFYMNIDSKGLLPGYLFSTNFPKSSDPFDSYISKISVPDKSNEKNVDGIITSMITKISGNGNKITEGNIVKIERDWNPDSRLIRRARIEIVYDSKKNLVRFPGYNISTKDISSRQKLILKKSIFNSKRGGIISSRHAGSGITGAVNSTGSTSSGTISSGSGVGGGMSGHGSSGNSGGGKQN